MDKTRIKAVIADDSRDFAFILKEFFDINGKIEVVEIARNGKDAYDFVMNHEVDLLLLDIIMPELNGIQVLEKLNGTKAEKVPKTIVLSAVSNIAYTNQALKLGADYFIVKPYDMIKLEKIIDDMFCMQEG